jgi:hypothetical protein
MNEVCLLFPFQLAWLVKLACTAAACMGWDGNLKGCKKERKPIGSNLELLLLTI